MKAIRVDRGQRYDPEGDYERMIERLRKVIAKHGRKLEIPLRARAWDIIRVDGRATCPDCGEIYYKHPMDKVNVDYQGEPYLYVGCDGMRLKT